MLATVAATTPLSSTSATLANCTASGDSDLLKTALERDRHLRRRLLAKASRLSGTAKAAGQLDDWLWQSRDLSRDVVYANLPAVRPAALGEEYFEATRAALERQLRRAGLRLAALLNQSFATRSPAGLP